VQFLRTIVIMLSAIVMAGASHAAGVVPHAPNGSSQAAATSAPAAKASAARTALGVSMLPGDRSKTTYDDFRARAGRAPALWSIWSDWGGPGDPSQSSSSQLPDLTFLNHLEQHGTAPFIFWQPIDPADLGTAKFSFKHIEAGDWDSYITAFAVATKAVSGPVLIRFAHEMDGDWFPWSIGLHGNTTTSFINAWRHIWTIFHNVGATNVRWVWSPNGCDCAKPTTRPLNPGLDALYPGDKYVDYLGASGFNWGSYKDRWATMQVIMKPRMHGFDSMNNTRIGRAGVRRKPIILAETASAPTGPSAHAGKNPPGNTKARWIKVGYDLIHSRYPRVKAIVYFNVDMRKLDSNEDWHLAGASMTAYRDLLRKASFRGRIQ